MELVYTILSPGWVWLLATPFLFRMTIAAMDAANLLPEEVDARHLGGTARTGQDNPEKGNLECQS